MKNSVLESNLLNTEEFKALAEHQDSIYISIFVPTNRAGKEAIEQQGSIRLKNELKAVKSKLEAMDWGAAKINKVLEPAENLINDHEFWQHQSDGLAIFIGENFFRNYTLPIWFQEFNYISDKFYLKPLIPMFNGDGRFFILSLSLGDIHFYEATRHTITDIIISDLIPENLDEILETSDSQKSLQFRSNQSSQGGAIFHGQGVGKDNRNSEISKYFRAVDKGLMKMLHDEDVPMIVACLDHFYPIYKEANTYGHLRPLHISGNPTDSDKLLIHEKAWGILAPYFDQTRQEKILDYQQKPQSSLTSSDISDILKATFEGRIDTLFIENRADIWGIYNSKMHQTQVLDDKQGPVESLLNLAAIQTFLQGGQVYLLEPEKMPDDSSEVNALFRY